MAIQASLTGHLVFSTLHTNDAASSITRLTNMGIEPFLVNATLAGAVAQRLVRKLCDHCKEHEEMSLEEFDRLRPILKKVGYEKDTPPLIHNASGCKFCSGTGSKGRSAIFEMMVMTNNIRNMCLKGSSEKEVKMQAIVDGMDTLFQSGLMRVLDGQVSLDELFRVCPPEELAIEIGGEYEGTEEKTGGTTGKKVPELAEAPKMLAPFVKD